MEGGGGREGRRSAAFREPEISPFTEVATATATLRLAGNGLAFRTNSFPFFEQFFFDFPHIWKSFPFALLFIDFFCLNSWEFKNGFWVVVVGSGDSLYFSIFVFGLKYVGSRV